MSDYFADAECGELYEQACALPDGRAKIELLEQSVRIADRLGDVRGAYTIRTELVETAVFNGYALKAITHFSWQLGQFDRDPSAYWERSLLWSYKWIVSNSLHFPQISRQQLMELMEDMRDRFVRAGYTNRTYYSNLFTFYIHTGEFELADEYYNKVQQMEREDISDCHACDRNEIVDYLAASGRDEEALEAAADIIKGKLSCTEIPHLTLATVLLPLYRLGRQKEAVRYQRKNYPMIRDNRDFLRSIGEHIAYLTYADPFQGLSLYEQHAQWSLDCDSPLDRMYFHAYAAGLFRVLARETVAFQIRLPESYPYAEDSTDVQSLSRHLQEMALELAEQFDRRNGTRYYSELIDQLSHPQPVQG
ncbi:hypothetical protein ACE3MZ_06585 [Paenibacillus sp. WLX1005]|uniref:hypothetical protein n=1 Tax=Paenibacillus sp. WLX1005 TaxID=3243766 RepID=UPI00398406E7